MKSHEENKSSPKRLTEEAFQKLVNNHIENFFKEFSPALRIHSSPPGFAEEERNRIESSITDLHNSSLDLNVCFFDIDKLRRNDKTLTYSQAIEKCCKNSNGSNHKSLFEFTANLIALYKIRDILIKKASQSNSGNLNTTQMENLKPDYTIARKVLTLSFLMDGSFENTNKPDKTIVAKFIESLISNNPPVDNITHTNLYDRVKALFYNPQEANVSDLQYVKGKFEDLGAKNIVKKLEDILRKKQKEQKEQ